MSRAKADVVMTRSQARQVVRLLGDLQDLLESAIWGMLAPGETDAFDPADQPMVNQFRRDWNAAEALIGALSTRRWGTLMILGGAGCWVLTELGTGHTSELRRAKTLGELEGYLVGLEKMVRRSKLAALIAKEEGFGRPGKIPTVRHNPGDLRHSLHSEHPGGPLHANDIGTIDSDADGWADLERQLRLYAARGMTLTGAIHAFAPYGDGANDPERYLAAVLAGFGGAVTADTPLEKVLEILA